MITNSKEKDQFQAKQAAGSKLPKAASNSSRQWPGFRNPRIVRVSRSFGGKDRHSKVCTIRGLRDRRIRLSVPTAIQLYDLQDRLGLSQPSKVVDWLLDATKTDIDKLPPLQMPQGNFGQFLQQPQLVNEANPPSAHLSSQLAPFFDANSLFMKNNGIKINDNNLEGEDQTLMARSSKHWDFDANLKAKSKEVGGEKWMKANVEGDLDGIGGGYNNTQVSAQNFFPPANQSSLPAAGLLNNNSMPYNSYYPWDPSNLSLSQFGSHGFSSQTYQVPHNIGSQLFYCPPSTVAPSLFPSYSPYNVATHHHSLESSSDPRQINHFQLLGSTNSLQNSLMQVPQLHCSPLKSFHVNSKLLPSQNINNGSSTTAEKDNNGS